MVDMDDSYFFTHKLSKKGNFAAIRSEQRVLTIMYVPLKQNIRTSIYKTVRRMVMPVRRTVLSYFVEWLQNPRFSSIPLRRQRALLQGPPPNFDDTALPQVLEVEG